MFNTALNRPAPNVVELTVFGLGFGEAAAVHVGSDAWILIDSCRQGAENVSLAYLNAIGVSPESVVAIVATHWDMDHVDGLTELVRACTHACLFVPAPLDVPAIRQHLVVKSLNNPPAAGKFRRATLQYGDALQAVAARHHAGGAGMRPAMELTPLYRRRDVEG